MEDIFKLESGCVVRTVILSKMLNADIIDNQGLPQTRGGNRSLALQYTFVAFSRSFRTFQFSLALHTKRDTSDTFLKVAIN